MDREALEKLDEFHKCEIKRFRLRFNGIGPRVHDKPDKIWPRDTLDFKKECEKILLGVKTKINQTQYLLIEGVLRVTIEGLREANIDKLFNKCCPNGLNRPMRSKLDKHVIHKALDDYTPHNQIIDMIHQIMRSINMSKSKRNQDFIKVLFGSHRNYDIFKQHVRLLVASNKQLRIISIGRVTYIDENMFMDLSQVSWLQDLSIELQYRVFMQVIYFIFRFIAELVQRYFYVTISNPYYDKLFYYRYDLWQKLKVRKIKELINQNILAPFSFDDFNSIPFNTISKMKFYLKKDDLRLICTQPKSKDVKREQFKAVLRFILNKSPNHEKFTLNNLLNSLRLFHQKIAEENKKVYIVRADIKNCFQSIDQDSLKSLIIERLCDLMGGDTLKLTQVNVLARNRKLGGRLWTLQWTLDLEGLKASEKFECVRIMEDLLIDIRSQFSRDYLEPHLKHPLIRESSESKNAYILTKGIRQGTSFSPILCSIYIQAAFDKHLKDFFTSKTCKIFCYVDDVLFLSTNLDEAQRFMHKMLKGFEDFNLRMNLNKLNCNFSCKGIEDNLCNLESGYVIFYKQQISTKTLQCSYDYPYESIELQDTFYVDPLADKETIMYNIKKYRVEAIHLDCKLNGLKMVSKNIFERALLFAHRAATMILCSLSLRNHSKQDPLFILKLIKTVAKRIFRTIKMTSERNQIENEFTYFHVRIFTVAAFKVTWNTNKMQHRKIERVKIDRVTRQYMMAHRASADSFSLPEFDLIIKIRELIAEFPSSPLAQKLILPSKRTISRQKNQ